MNHHSDKLVYATDLPQAGTIDPHLGGFIEEFHACPKCGGKEIVYSCEPKCCFNHVCSDCRSTFELNTEKTGRSGQQTKISAQEPDSSDPTTCCASCGSLRLAVLSSTSDETLLLCADCRAISKLLIEEFVPGNF
jgi:hypothetical protein